MTSVLRRRSHCHRLVRLGEIHASPRLSNRFKQALYLGDIIGRCVEVHTGCEQLADRVAVKLTEIYRNITAALVVEATLQASQNTAGLGQILAYLLLVFVVR